MSRQSTRPAGEADERARRAAPARGADRRRALRAVRTERADTPWRVVGAALSGVLVLVVAGLVVLLVVLPKSAGGTAMTVLTGSMQPTLRPGDVVVVRGVDTADVCDKVKVGDVVTFLPEPGDPSTVTHRVVAKTVGTFDDGTTCRLVTQGDANNTADEPISPEQVRGVFWYGLPRLGWAKQWVLDNPTVVLGALAVVVVVSWLAPRRRTTRVITVPSAPPPTSDAPPADRVPSDRELALREREVAVREAELALARAAPASVAAGSVAAGGAAALASQPGANPAPGAAPRTPGGDHPPPGGGPRGF